MKLPNGHYEDFQGKRYILQDHSVEHEGKDYQVMFTDDSEKYGGLRIVAVGRHVTERELLVVKGLRRVEVIDVEGEVRPGRKTLAEEVDSEED